jgi:hypothetical protein
MTPYRVYNCYTTLSQKHDGGGEMSLYLPQTTSKTPQGLTFRKTTGETPKKATGETFKKTTHVTAEQTTHRSYKPRARNCKNCGHNFKPKSKHGRYCSDNCRKAAWKREQGRKNRSVEPQQPALKVIVCAGCDESFFGLPGQKHCKASCKTAAWRIRRSAAIVALAVDMAISEAKAADAVDFGGMKKITAYLTARGYSYDAAAKAWLMTVAV